MCIVWRRNQMLTSLSGHLSSEMCTQYNITIVNDTEYLDKTLWRKPEIHRICNVKLADILGHSSINTTRIYIITTGNEHRQRMETMRLII